MSSCRIHVLICGIICSLSVVSSQLHFIGSYFTRQLLESRHRGAFELAYAGFVQMTEMLWHCPLPAASSLPRQWLEDLMSEVRVHDPTDRLCSTRRSAGVPFYVQVKIHQFVYRCGLTTVLYTAWLVQTTTIAGR